MTRVFFLIILVAFASFFTVLGQIREASSISGENVMAVQDAGFAFGWSGITGEKWTVNSQIIILNNKALAAPPPTPINGDAGSIQINLYIIYANNIGFIYGWSANVGERYRPSTSMATGASQGFNSEGPLAPPSTSINQDAGSAQENPALIYLSGVGFYYGWSSNVSERYRPSTSIAVGASQGFNGKGPLAPPTTPINGYAGISQENPALIYLNGIGFSFGWSLNSSDSYRPSPTMEVGPLTPFNNEALVVPPSWAVGIPEFPSFPILPLFMIVALLAVIVYKRKKSKLCGD